MTQPQTLAIVVALDVRPATERSNRVLGVGAKDVVFSDMPLIDRDGLIAIITGNDIPSVGAPASKQAAVGPSPLRQAHRFRN